jgi:metal-dependent amidase/aminoacylase/carboxypeptidase family protein
VRNDVEKEIERIVQGTCLTADASYELSYTRGYPSVVNHPEETAFLASAASQIDEVHTVEETEPHMTGEDFSYYLQHIKGTFFFTGAQPEGVDAPYPHHHPKFDFNEKAMLIAAKTLGTAAVEYLREQAPSKNVIKAN